MGSKSTNNDKPNITKTDGHLIKYFSDTFSRGSHAGHPSTVEPQGIDATGGFISVYEDPTTSGVYYKSHTFTGSGTFTVNSLNDGPNQIEYVVVAGGGGGGGYALTSGTSPNYHVGTKGNPSNFDHGGSNPVESLGGGGGGVYTRPIAQVGNTYDFGPIAPGGSGGGGCGQPGTSGNPEVGGNGTPLQGYPGGRGYHDPVNMWRGAGGGGAGGAGENGGPQTTTGWSLPANNGVGGDGVYTRIINGALTGLAGGGSCGGRRAAEGAGLENNRNPNGTFGGGYGGADIRGGDASAHSGSGGGGGDGGGGAGSAGGGAGGYRSSVVGESSGGGGPAESKFTVAAGSSYSIVIGGGGSGSHGFNTPSTFLQPNTINDPSDYSSGGGNGASGVVVVRYPVPSLASNNSYKASGGQVYQWVAPNASAIGNGNESITVHVFTGAGSFVAPESFNETVEYLIIGGGGGGGVGGNAEGGGGGGAGGFLSGTLLLVGSQNLTINVGGGGLGGTPAAVATVGGNSSIAGLTVSTLTAFGGGRGGSGYDQTDSGASAGGSAGGHGYDPNPGVAVNATDPNQGNSGGRYDSPFMGGGGGGAGGAGVPGSATAGSGGHGGLGKQFPITFQSPNAMDFAKGYPGPGGTGFWVAGGGAGGVYNYPYTSLDCRGAGPGGPFAGAGDGGKSAGPGNPLHVSNCTPGRRYSGSGGGGGAYQLPGMTGGSGIVLIAYRT